MPVGECVSKNNVSYARMPHYLLFTDIITDTADFLPYTNKMTPHLILLGTVLGIDDFTFTVMNGPGDPQTKCLTILKQWMDVTPNPTWDLFCENLRKSSTLNRLRGRIEEDHDASGVTVMQVTVILMWLYVVDTCIASKQWFCYDKFF